MSVARVGWCPGTLNPMMAGDGVILRVKPRGGRLSLDQARGIADIARRCGNGALDLTQRANVQIRGLQEAGLPTAIGALANLGLVDPSPEAEAVRNVVSSPLAGSTLPLTPDQARSAAGPGSSSDAGILDPGSSLRSVQDERRRVLRVGNGDIAAPGHRAGIFDVTACVTALEDRLVGTPALHRLPAKFCFVVDGGGTLSLRDVPADLRFEAFADRDGQAFAVRLGGAEDEMAGRCRPEDVADVAETLARVLMDAASEDETIRRMAGLVARKGAEAILRCAGLAPIDAPRPRAASARDAIGPLGAAFGIGAPFGRLDAAQLDAIVAAARSELRLTPWRAILLPGVVDAGNLAGSGLIVDRADSRHGIAACVGAPGCHRATTRVREDAARLAVRFRLTEAGIALHVSGCGKGCAHGGPAPLTLVGRDGRYDLVLDGRADAAPAERGLDVETAMHSIERQISSFAEGEGGGRTDRAVA